MMNDDYQCTNPASYSPLMSLKKMAFKATLNGLGVAVAYNPVKALVALTVIVCCPADTPLYWKPDIPSKPVTFIYVIIVLQVTRIAVYLLTLQPSRVNPHIQVKWATFSLGHVGCRVKLNK